MNPTLDTGYLMPKRLPEQVKAQAMTLFLEGIAAKDIAETVSRDHKVTVKPSTIYAWSKQYNWKETQSVSRANAIEKAAESETERFQRIQQEHLDLYGALRTKASTELHVNTFDRASDAAKALDLGIKGERQVMEGFISLNFISEVMAILVDEIKDGDTLARIAVKLKTLVASDNE